MARFWVVAAVVAVAFMVYSLVDCSMTDSSRIRGPRKIVWIVLILLLPVLGGILWFVVGRGRTSGARTRATRTVAPDDDPAFLSRLKREADQAERIRKLEEELSDLDTDPDPRRPDEAGDEPDRRDA
ncbi:MAG TPA: PLDc N-terminal domain-containing protein [Naasia sp.]|jgi:hypothetical protein